MTPASTRSAAPTLDSARDARPDLHLSQVLASALAAVTAAVVGSTLGVAGTLVGAAVGSVIATAGSALYSSWLRRTGTRVRAVVVRTTDGPGQPRPLRETQAVALAEPREQGPRRSWRLAAGLSVAAFVLGMAAITGFEAVAGTTVSSITTGHDAAGTSLGDVLSPETSTGDDPAPDPSPTNPASVAPTTTPTTSPTPSITATVTPTEPPESSPSPTETSSPTTSPSGATTAPPT